MIRPIRFDAVGRERRKPVRNPQKMQGVLEQRLARVDALDKRIEAREPSIREAELESKKAGKPNIEKLSRGISLLEEEIADFKVLLKEVDKIARLRKRLGISLTPQQVVAEQLRIFISKDIIKSDTIFLERLREWKERWK